MHDFLATSLVDAEEAHFGSLSSLFLGCREILGALRVDVASGRLKPPYCLLREWETFESETLQTVRDSYPLSLQSPFEGVSSISGGVWNADACGLAGDDAIVKLRFEPGTNDLPIHVHDYSDRVIHVVGGSATFCVQKGRVRNSYSIGTGCSLMFSRGLAHTFQTDADALLLLSYHAPFVALDDPRQFRIHQSDGDTIVGLENNG